jgi:hypothetical protein
MSDVIVLWLKSTALSHAMVESRWLWPLSETLHFIGLALLIGAAGLLDLRLLGFMRRIPVDAAMQLRPWAALGVAINAITGMLFFVGAPHQYIHNGAWWAKVAFLIIAVGNIALFETAYARDLLALPPDADPPRAVKVVGIVSIFSWFGVLYFGRMLPFIGNAF